MGLNIKNQEVERLAAEIALKTGETKTEAIRVALEERRQKLGIETKEQKMARMLAYLEAEVWPLVPPNLIGKAISKADREKLLGYGQDGGYE